MIDVPLEADATLNFAATEDGLIAMNLIYHGGFDKHNRAHAVMFRVDEWLKSQAHTIAHETINGEDVTFIPSSQEVPRAE